MSELPVLQSPLLSALPGVRHAFFTRRGGVSKGVYESLNLGRGSADDPAAVAENRARAAAWFGVGPEALLSAYQIHSAIAHRVDYPWAEAPKGDGLVTATPALALGALSADCAPILIVEPEARLIASAHAGWRGALGGVVDTTIRTMIAMGARPERLVAAVGPCIGPRSYEVGLEFFDRFAADAPGSERFFRPGAGADKRLFDLPGFVLDRLASAGVGQAEWIGHDTCLQADDFFSNRRNVLRGEGDYGRLMSAVMLER